MKKTLASVAVVSAALFAIPSFGTGCSAEVNDDLETDVPVGASEDGLAPAIGVGACLLNPACAASVAAVLGYTVYNVSQIPASSWDAVQRAANDWFASQRRGQTCTANCALILANSAGGTGSGGQCSGSVSGTGSSHAGAQKDANNRVPRGCRLKHCTIRCR